MRYADIFNNFLVIMLVVVRVAIMLLGESLYFEIIDHGRAPIPNHHSAVIFKFEPAATEVVFDESFQGRPFVVSIRHIFNVAAINNW